MCFVADCIFVIIVICYACFVDRWHFGPLTDVIDLVVLLPIFQCYVFLV